MCRGTLLLPLPLLLLLLHVAGGMGGQGRRRQQPTVAACLAGDVVQAGLVGVHLLADQRQLHARIAQNKNANMANGCQYEC